MKASLSAIGSRWVVSLALCGAGAGLSGCASSDGGEEDDVSSSADSLSVTSSFVARGTGYYPDHSALEGGFVDRRGVKLRTLQQFLAGEAAYVSVAMDSSAFGYGQHLRIRELDAKYGRPIDFRVVDTGGAFRGRGRSRIDICVANRKASVDATINGTLHIDAVTGFAPSPP
jgi:3D (Asp-Asp-Asp) domain-containing protein